MKRIYEKPALFAESFWMAEHIASGCYGAFDQSGNAHVHDDGNSCRYVDAKGAYFTQNTMVCEDAIPIRPGTPMEGLFDCYQGPAGGSATPFAS